VLDALLDSQCGVITRSQAIRCGVTVDAIRAKLRSERWQRVYRTTYLTFSGPIPRRSQIWAALLAAGEGAAASHFTAAELWGLNAWSRTQIHVTIPKVRRIAPLEGVVIHRSPNLEESRHPARVPCRTRVEYTAADLIGLAERPDDVVDLLTSVCAKRLTTPPRLAEVIRSRTNLRWRPIAIDALTDVRDGCRSVMEVAYLRRVERSHGLPKAQRQSPETHTDGGRVYRDVRYPGFGLVIELDGKASHPADELRRHLRRDNSGTLDGDLILHFSWNDVSLSPCATAAQVATVLRARGWSKSARRCGSTCAMVEC
jgi:hypothetical protein